MLSKYSGTSKSVSPEERYFEERYAILGEITLRRTLKPRRTLLEYGLVLDINLLLSGKAQRFW